MVKSKGTKKRYYRKHKKRQTTNIYVIKAGRYFYIGKSNNPWARVSAHQDKAVNNLGHNDKKNRIFRQYLHNLKLQVLEKPKMKNWRKREIYWIAHYRKKYGRDRVLNRTDGGDGASGGGWDDEVNTGCLSVILSVMIICLIMLL